IIVCHLQDHRSNQMVDNVDPAGLLVNTSPQSTTEAAIAADPEVWTNNFFGLEMPADILSILYAGTVALGGAIGYATKGELMILGPEFRILILEVSKKYPF